MDKLDILYRLIEFLIDEKKAKPSEVIKKLQEISQEYDKL